MTPALVKFTVDLFAPGAILSTTLTNWFAKHAAFHSRRTIWPVKPLQELLDINDQGSMALVDFAHVRVTSIMDGYDGATDGELDRLLTEHPIPEVFDLDRVCGTALQLAPPYVINKTRASWVELFEMEDKTVTLMKRTSVEEIADVIKRVPTE